MIDPGPAMAVAAGLLLAGVLASKLSDRFGVPSLLLFLAIGVLAGSEGPGGIEFDDYELAQTVGVVALAFILFGGGFDTDWRAVRPVLAPGLLLATVGVAVTAVVTGLVAARVLDVSTTTGLLLGSIVSSTDAAAVFATLRSRNVSLQPPLRPLLELESGSNDPMAVFLTVACIELLTEPGTSVVDLVPLFVAQMGVGTVAGYVLARLAVVVLNRLRLGYEGLYPVALVAVVLGVFGLTSLAGGSGFVAVYVAGLTLGNARRVIHRRSLKRFADGLSWLMQIAVFLSLGLLVVPSELGPIAGRALLVTLALMAVARPVAVVPLLAPFRPGLRRMAMVSWVGLRGAVPIVLATYPLVEGVPGGRRIFAVVFFIVIVSVLVQGTSIPLVARRLRVDAPLERRPAYPVEATDTLEGSMELHELAVPAGSAAVGRRLVDLHLPPGALVVLISRGEEFTVPQGSTTLEAGDTLLLLADRSTLPAARAVIEGRDGEG